MQGPRCLLWLMAAGAARSTAALGLWVLQLAGRRRWLLPRAIFFGTQELLQCSFACLQPWLHVCMHRQWPHLHLPQFTNMRAGCACNGLGTRNCAKRKYKVRDGLKKDSG